MVNVAELDEREPLTAHAFQDPCIETVPLKSEKIVVSIYDESGEGLAKRYVGQPIRFDATDPFEGHDIFLDIAGKKFAVKTRDGYIRIWDLESDLLVAEGKGRVGPGPREPDFYPAIERKSEDRWYCQSCTCHFDRESWEAEPQGSCPGCADSVENRMSYPGAL